MAWRSTVISKHESMPWLPMGRMQVKSSVGVRERKGQEFAREKNHSHIAINLLIFAPVVWQIFHNVRGRKAAWPKTADGGPSALWDFWG